MATSQNNMETSNNRQQIGAMLRQARTDAGLTLQQLAEQSGINYTIISKIEAGKRNPSISLICDLANALGLNITLSSIDLESE